LAKGKTEVKLGKGRHGKVGEEKPTGGTKGTMSGRLTSGFQEKGGNEKGDAKLAMLPIYLGGARRVRFGGSSDKQR